MEKYLNSLVMVVDDEPANIFFMEGLLSGEGYKVVTAASGKECLELTQKELPDVFLLDIMMPEMTGSELLTKLIENKKTSEIPAIMVTALSDSKNIETCMDLGAIDYIRKPIDEVELLARLRTALRIKKQEDKLREVLKSKMEFINIITHDLRTPFNSISGFAELLYYDEELSGILKKDHKEFLKYIINTSSYAVDYFNKLLNWANLGASELRLMKIPVQLSKLVHSNAIIFKSQIEDKKINLQIDIPEQLEIELDETYFGQVIKNIISNAVKFTKMNGSIKIYTTTDSDKTSLIISDSGIGMRNDTSESIFSQSFVQSKRGTKGEPGTGIGLAICKKIIDAHNFSIDFKSQEGKGTDFTIQMTKGTLFASPYSD